MYPTLLYEMRLQFNLVSQAAVHLVFGRKCLLIPPSFVPCFAFFLYIYNSVVSIK